MDRTSAIKDVPKKSLKEIQSDFESEGAKVTLVAQPDGLWTVLARFPDADMDLTPAPAGTEPAGG